MLFKDYVRYENINNLKPFFGKKFMIHGARIYQMTQKKDMIYLIILKLQEKKRNAYDDQHKLFHGRFNGLSVLRSPFKLKILKCSQRHCSKLAVHRSSMIEVIIPEHIS